jgi:carboxypeptidase family protein
MRRNLIIRFLFARRLCSAGLLLWLCGVGVQASAATRLTGSLTDPERQSVADATISLERRADSTRRKTTTDAQGQFFFDSVDGGEYRLAAESPGFAVLTQTLVVQVDGYQTKNLQFLSLASQSESVTVTALVQFALKFLF